MTNLIKRYEVLIKTSYGSYREVTIMAKSAECARSIAENVNIKNNNESVCSVYPSSFSY